MPDSPTKRHGGHLLLLLFFVIAAVDARGVRGIATSLFQYLYLMCAGVAHSSVYSVFRERERERAATGCLVRERDKVVFARYPEKDVIYMWFPLGFNSTFNCRDYLAPDTVVRGEKEEVRFFSLPTAPHVRSLSGTSFSGGLIGDLIAGIASSRVKTDERTVFDLLPGTRRELSNACRICET